MREYLLFIDTEGSDLPKQFNVPYSSKYNWPHSIQVSWIIFTNDGQEIKQENHFIKEDDFTIAPSALEVHGITYDFLRANGKRRKEVLTLLANDFEAYQPLVVGHFMELDARMIGADFFRSGIANPLEKLPAFCTMRASAHLVNNPRFMFLRLFDLYKELFKCELLNQHNALVDARATAECFFEMLKRGDVNEKKIDELVTYYTEPILKTEKGCSFILALIFIFITFTALCL